MNNQSTSIPESAPEHIRKALKRRKACDPSRPCKCKGRAKKAVLRPAENMAMPLPRENS